MATRKTVSQEQKVLNFLNTGKALSNAVATHKLRVNRLPAKINVLRAKGYAIYTNTNKAGNPTYRLGTPSRAMIASAFAQNGSALFS
tara:strand:- start:3286 stop:3546 length:261 start_codon:yes stop_codon:yes gene_type:complete